ncbi:MAG TPA: hypothetical protein VK708_14470, partial [Bryobacteraceae bacterium]|nr:hypothetical protein [Bryobacteraceae bacterium]
MKLLFISAILAAFAAIAPSRANAAPCISLPPIDPAKGFVTNFNNSCYVLPLVAGDSHVAGDLNASYTDVYYQVTPGYELIVLGIFPNARFMAATVYDDHMVPVSNLIDSAILPLNANMINPMVPGATYKPNQSYGLTISFGGGPPASVSPGCSMLPSVAGNVLDASQIHQGITWSGYPNLPPGFPAHETGANAAGIITIRKYMDIDSPVLPEYVIVRSLANGCAIPIQQAVQSNIVSVTQHVDSSWLHQDQISAHLQFSNTVQPWLDFPSDPLNGVFWRRPSEYIPFNDSYAGYLSASFSSAQIKSLLTAQNYLRIQFQIPTTPTTPCANGNCSLSGNEQTRYVSLSLQAPVVNCTGHTTILSIADQNLVQDANGIVTVVAGFGAPQPPNVTAANGYTWLDLSSVPNHNSISGLIIRNLAPNPSFQCSTFSVPYKTSEYNPDGGYMGSYAATVDFPTASQIPAVPVSVSRPNSCSLVPTQAPQALSTSTGVQSCSSNDYLSAYTATVGSAAGSGSVLLTAGGIWSASSNASWLQLSPGSTGG